MAPKSKLFDHRLPKGIDLLIILGVALWVSALLSACIDKPLRPPPTLDPTPTRPLAIPNNQNVEALNAAKAAQKNFEFGFAPLLEKKETRVVVKAGPKGQIAWLVYPLQPANPADWSAGDSFVLSYAIRQNLLRSPHVLSVALGRFGVAAPLENLQEQVDHVAVWVRFGDDSQAIVDFSPLASNFGSLHTATELLVDEAQIEAQFAERQHGAPLDRLQPMKVISKKGNVYYLLSKVVIAPERYEFLLQVYLTQTATPIRPLQLTRGAMAKVTINRSDFETIQQLLLTDGPTALSQKPDLLNFAGDRDSTMQAILTEHLPLLWHLTTKLDPPPANPVATPVPTAGPNPTRTPIPLPPETS